MLPSRAAGAMPQKIAKDLGQMATACRRLLTRSSVFQRCVLSAVCLGYALSFSQRTAILLTISPYALFHRGEIWRLFTFWAMENGILGLLYDFCLIHLVYRIVQPCWGERRVCYFFIFVNLAVAVISCVALSLLYALSDGVFSDYPTTMSVRGLSGFGGAVIYVLARTFPQNPVHTIGRVRIKAVHLPAICACLYLGLTLLTMYIRGAQYRTSEHYFVMYLSGLFCAWVYFLFCDKASVFAKPNSNFLSPMYSTLVDMDSLSDVKVVVNEQPKLLQDTAGAANAERYRQKAIRDLNERLATGVRTAPQPIAAATKTAKPKEVTTEGTSPTTI